MIPLTSQLDSLVPTAMCGSIVRTEGVAAAARGLPAPVGSIVSIERLGTSPVEAEVIGFRDRETILYPLAEMTGVRRGDRVVLRRTRRMIRVGDELLGRVIDARGKTIDRRPQPVLTERLPLVAAPPLATDRPRIE